MGNNKLREAILAIKDINDNRLHDAAGYEINDIINDALAEPPRQCDVGTPEEQAERFGKLCGKHYNEEESCNEECPFASLPIIHGFPRCQAYWAQTPYRAKEGGAK